jgi:hypothetical protein
MAFVIRSLDGVDHPFGTNAEETAWRDLASKLNKIDTKVIDRISRVGLINISKWLSVLNKEAWEVGVAQDFDTKKLRLIRGAKSTDFNVAARVSSENLKSREYIIVHVHPVFRTNRNHLNKDRKAAFEFLEGVLDWSDVLTCYDSARIYNPFVSGSGGRLISAEAMHTSSHIPFLSGNDIVGYAQFDKETKRPVFKSPFSNGSTGDSSRGD